MVIIYLLLGFLLTDTSVLCQNNTWCNGITFQQCPKDVSITSSPSSPQEGDNVTLTCNIKCDNSSVTFQWKKDEMELKENLKSTLVLENVLESNNGKYVCSVKSSCYCCISAPYVLTVKSNTVIILVICGVSALGLVVIMGLIMKCKLKRDNDKHRERMRQRAQAGQAGGPIPFTPRGT